jgi:predicted negative regulator of RcsB-dependent stress response
MLGVIAWVGYRAYQSSYVAAMENSAEVYAGVRSGLEGLKGNNSALAEKLEKREELAKKLETAKAEGKDTKDDEKALTDLVAEVTSLEKGRDDQVASLSEKLEVLQEQRAPYGLLVDGYRDLLNVRLGRKDGLGDALATVKWREAKPESRERLLSELRALLLARALVDVDGQKNTALETLKNLALDGEFVHAAAGQAWATVYQDGKSGDSAVAAEIKALLEQIVEKHPEQAENFPSLQ